MLGRLTRATGSAGDLLGVMTNDGSTTRTSTLCMDSAADGRRSSCPVRSSCVSRSRRGALIDDTSWGAQAMSVHGVHNPSIQITPFSVLLGLDTYSITWLGSKSSAGTTSAGGGSGIDSRDFWLDRTAAGGKVAVGLPDPFPGVKRGPAELMYETIRLLVDLLCRLLPAFLGCSGSFSELSCS